MVRIEFETNNDAFKKPHWEDEVFNILDQIRFDCLNAWEGIKCEWAVRDSNGNRVGTVVVDRRNEQ